MAEPETKDEPIVLHYTGDGTSYIPGVPQRDLTAEDVAAIPPDALQEAKASGLYERTERGDKKPSKAAKGGES
jgi:hypothetical protein